MSDNLPARRSVDLLAVAQQADAVKTLGSTLLASGLLPNAIKKPEAAVAIMLRGNELGIGPMQALDSISVIQGNPTLSSELMRALVQRAGHKFRVREETDERCIVEGIRRDDPEFSQRVTFSMEDARRAGVSGKDNWKKHPRAMLLARATSALCRAMFADVIAGCSYVPEELGAEVNEEGEIVEAHAVSASPSPQEKDKLPATRKQLNYLEALAEDAVEGGVPGFEEMAGKTFSELTRGEASEWVSRLSGRLPAHEPTNEVHRQPPVEPSHEEPANEVAQEAEVVSESEHALVLTELQRIYYRIPDEKRPDEDAVFAFAEKGLAEAQKGLARIRSLAAEAGMLPESEEDEEIVREYVEESVPSGPHPEQEEVIEELAEKLYGNESKVLSGLDWLEEKVLGHPISELTKSRAKELIDTMCEELSTQGPSRGQSRKAPA